MGRKKLGEEHCGHGKKDNRQRVVCCNEVIGESACAETSVLECAYNIWLGNLQAKKA